MVPDTWYLVLLATSSTCCRSTSPSPPPQKDRAMVNYISQNDPPVGPGSNGWWKHQFDDSYWGITGKTALSTEKIKSEKVQSGELSLR